MTDRIKRERVPLAPLQFPYIIFTDGAARGRNGEGPASSGFVAFCELSAKPIYSCAVHIGNQTNNVAEYQALINALNWVIGTFPAGKRHVHFKSDSELMVRQINGVYRVGTPHIIGLVNSVQMRLKKLDAWKLEHIRREFNKEADAVCNEVLDAYKESGVDAIEHPE